MVPDSILCAYGLHLYKRGVAIQRLRHQDETPGHCQGPWARKITLRPVLKCRSCGHSRTLPTT
jgi:hypothetical protein